MANFLWGEKAQFRYLFLAAIILLLGMLGSHDIWTQEHRWADIVSGMFYRHDFWHPYLGENNYYDKPLLSYWLIAAFSFITGPFSLWAMRLPSALAGLLAIWSIYRIGLHFKNKQFGLLAGWLLLTTFYFIFWARTSSADMLNMAGSLFAVSWYIEYKNKPSFFHFTIFFLILALTSLCKGLVCPVIVMLAILPDIIKQNNWKNYIRLPVFLSVFPAAIVYVLPFWLSSYYSNDQYHQNGLYLVYRENIVRYFHPFDHKDPIYTYFIFLPIYLFPWVFFFFPALLSIKTRWKQMSWNSKWLIWMVFLLFAFFTLSGSRRSYYVLPIVPFAILFTADWILSGELANTCLRWANRTILLFFSIFILIFCVFQPLYYSQGSLQDFAKHLKQTAEQTMPWSQWNIVMLDAESKLNFYLQLPPQVKHYPIQGNRNSQNEISLLKTWPMLKDHKPHTIFITRKAYESIIAKLLPDYKLISAGPRWEVTLLNKKDPNTTIAFIPK